MANASSQTLAATGTTGNNTHAAIDVPDAQHLVCQLFVEAVGATPQITFKLQGSYDGTNWYDLPFTIENSTAVATAARNVNPTVASTGYIVAVDMLQPARAFPRARLVTSANTNTTYRATAYSVLYSQREV